MIKCTEKPIQSRANISQLELLINSIISGFHVDEISKD